MEETRYYDNIVIHYYASAKHFKTSASFRKGKKVVSEMAAIDVEDVLDYMSRHSFCNGLPYRIIRHK